MAERQRSLWTDALRRMRRDRLAIAALAVILLYLLITASVLCGDAARWLERKASDAQAAQTTEAPVGEKAGEGYLSMARVLRKLDVSDGWDRGSDDKAEWHQPPSWAHPFGTDLEGRDVLKRTLYGAKIALSVGFVVGLTSVIIGLILGAIAGYRPGLIDELIVWLYTTIDAIPYILLLVALSFVLKSLDLDPLVRIWIAMTATFWTGTARVIRGEVIRQRSREYVVAAQAIGASGPRILFGHIVPNVLHLAIVNFSLLFVGAIKNEVILSYLGLGVIDQPSWGILIDNARMELAGGFWWQLTAATGAMFLLVLAFNVFSDALRDALDPRLHR